MYIDYTDPIESGFYILIFMGFQYWECSSSSFGTGLAYGNVFFFFLKSIDVLKGKLK